MSPMGTESIRIVPLHAPRPLRSSWRLFPIYGSNTLIEPINMSTSPPSKRSKTSNENTEESPDLLALFQSDIGIIILSYASASELCTLDALSRKFQRLTIEPWKRITEETFGMKNGKDDWIVGSSFLRRPVFTCVLDESDHGYGDLYSGSASVAANESMIVAVADEVNGYTWDGTYPSEQNGMGIRDAYTLNYIRTTPSPITNWRVAICGRVGSEIIVTSNSYQICARRGNDLQQWEYNTRARDGIPIIGCDTHLVVGRSFEIEIFCICAVEVGTRGTSTELLSVCQTCAIESNLEINSISWNSNKTHFIISCGNSISVWKFDAVAGSATLTQTIEVADAGNMRMAALADDYVVGSSNDKKLHIWSRNSGEKLRVLCDAEEDDEVDEEYTIYPIQTYCHGNLLISTSHYGCALCIWNLKTGKLLKRHNEAEDERHADMLPDGNDVTEMAYLPPLNAFVCMAWCMAVWAFPTNKRQKGMAKSIRRREERMRRALHSEF